MKSAIYVLANAILFLSYNHPIGVRAQEASSTSQVVPAPASSAVDVVDDLVSDSDAVIESEIEQSGSLFPEKHVEPPRSYVDINNATHAVDEGGVGFLMNSTSSNTNVSVGRLGYQKVIDTVSRYPFLAWPAELVSTGQGSSQKIEKDHIDYIYCGESEASKTDYKFFGPAKPLWAFLGALRLLIGDDEFCTWRLPKAKKGKDDKTCRQIFCLHNTAVYICNYGGGRGETRGEVRFSCLTVRDMLLKILSEKRCYNTKEKFWPGKDGEGDTSWDGGWAGNIGVKPGKLYLEPGKGIWARYEKKDPENYYGLYTIFQVCSGLAAWPGSTKDLNYNVESPYDITKIIT